jgi:hypothetical protein
MADVYVSLNRYGNMSNTVLEAMSQGTCPCLLEPDEDGTDESTARLIPSDAAVRVPRRDTVIGLARALSNLLADPIRMATVGRAATVFAASYLCSWEERLAWEVRLLERLSRGEKLGFSGIRDDWRAVGSNSDSLRSPCGTNQQAPMDTP